MHKSFILPSLLILTACMAHGEYNENDGKHNISRQTTARDTTFDARNSSFTVDGQTITLVNEMSEMPIENSSAIISTRFFGHQTQGDLNGDGLEDHAFLITQSMGGSGTFYYVIAALKTNDGYKTTNAFLVGDRIEPQSVEIRSDSGELHVNYASHKQGEPMTSQPSEGKLLLLKVTPNGVLEGLMK